MHFAPALTRHVDFGQLEIDNSAVRRSAAVCSSAPIPEVSAKLRSTLTGTPRLNGLDPSFYVRTICACR
jgi:hypothetical protein